MIGKIRAMLFSGRSLRKRAITPEDVKVSRLSFKERIKEMQSYGFNKKESRLIVLRKTGDQ